MTTWTTTDRARTWWADAADFEDEELQELLDIAAEECEAFAPKLPADAPVPLRYQMACIYQARDIYTVSRRQGDEELVGDGAYAIRPRILSGAVKQLLRPMQAVPRFGRRKSTA